MHDSPRPSSTVLVLGAAVWPGGAASPALRRRVLRGVEVWRALGPSLFIVTGGPGQHGPSEAEVGADLARQAGIPEPAVWEERHARSTLENLLRCRDLLPEGLPEPVYVVTDWYHAPRAKLAALVLGLPVQMRLVAPPLSSKGLLSQLRQVLREGIAIGPTVVQALRHRGRNRARATWQPQVAERSEPQ